MPGLRKFGKVWYAWWREGGHQFTRRISTRKGIADEFLQRLRERLDRERAGLPVTSLTPAEFSEQHLWRLEARVAAGDLAASTKRRAADAWGHLLGWLGKEQPQIRRLSALSPALFRDYQLYRASRVRARTVNTELLLIGAAFRTAVREGRLVRSPLEGLQRLKEKDSTPAAVISREQAAKLLKWASPEFRPYLLGYLYTGARRGELQAVRWEDIDLRAASLTLQNLKTHSQAADRTRLVPLHPALARLLRRLKAAPATARAAGPWPPVPNETLRRWFLETTKAARLPHLTRLHDLRHAFAGALVSQGEDLYVVGRLLGHRDPATTMRYAHLQPETLRRAVRKLKF